METSASCLSGFFMAFLLLQITIYTQAMSLDIQINIQVPDTEGVLVECTSGSLIPPAEMIWRDIKGNIIPHSSTFGSQDRVGLLYLKSSILLKNTHGPITCSIYNVTTNLEKKRSIVLPDVIFKPEYMSLMSNRFSYPVIYLIIILVINFFRGILAFSCIRENFISHFIEQNIKIKKDLKVKMRHGYELICECLLLVLHIAFLPLYLKFRTRASILDDVYPLYSNWLWDICIILVVMMIFFTVLILCLLWILNYYCQMTPSSISTDAPVIPSEQNISVFAELNKNGTGVLAELLEMYEEGTFMQHQESCRKEFFNVLQPLRLDCSLNWETRQ